MPERAGSRIDQSWTDLASVCGELPSQSQVAGYLIAFLFNAVEQLEIDGG